MRILSLWQPWATLCVSPDKSGRIAKRIETRHFPPRVKLPCGVLIHAAQRVTEMRALEYGKSMHPNAALIRQLLRERGFTTGNVPLGAIVGIATLTGSRFTEDVEPQLGTTERILGDYSAGRYAWFLTGAQALTVSVPFKGRQSVLWEAPPEIIARVEEMMR